MIEGIEIKDLTIGTGDEATSESIVVANIREFLHRGDEVSPSPLFGTKRVMDLQGRECILGLRFGIPGMRVGGTREIVISPHLAHGESGIPGRIPGNAVLRCKVELLEIRKDRALLPQDWLPGKILHLRHSLDVDNRQSPWEFDVHESGNSMLCLRPKFQKPEQLNRSEIPIQLEAEDSAELIQQAMDLPNQMPEACLDWNSGFIDMKSGGTLIKDSRDGARCIVVRVRESGRDVSFICVHENSPRFRDSAFYKTIERLITPHLQ